jgi:hypothetical protein
LVRKFWPKKVWLNISLQTVSYNRLLFILRLTFSELMSVDEGRDDFGADLVKHSMDESEDLVF